MTTYRICLCFRRRFRPASSEPPKVVKEVFRNYSEGRVMGAEQLQRFLVEVQEEAQATREAAQAVIDGMRDFRPLKVFQRNGFSLDAFFRYLTGDDNSTLSHSLGVYQDMSAPLSHYFVYTGHNSYLTGNQLSSECSDVPIIRALQRGVRVIELDIWPNSTKNDVEVRHGGCVICPDNFY